MQKRPPDSLDSEKFSKKNFVASFIWRPLGSLLGLALLALIVVLVMGLVSWHMSDPSLSYASGNSVQNIVGRLGAIYADLSMQLLGLASLALLLPLFFWASLLIMGRPIGYGFFACVFLYN